MYSMEMYVWRYLMHMYDVCKMCGDILNVVPVSHHTSGRIIHVHVVAIIQIKEKVK